MGSMTKIRSRILLRALALAGLTLFAATPVFSAKASSPSGSSKQCLELLSSEISQISSAPFAPTSASRLRIQTAPGAIERLSGPVLGTILNHLFPSGIISSKNKQLSLHSRHGALQSPALQQKLQSHFLGLIEDFLNSSPMKPSLEPFKAEFNAGPRQFKFKIGSFRLLTSEGSILSLGQQPDYQHGTIVRLEVQLDQLEARVGALGLNSESSISLSLPVFFGVQPHGKPEFRVLPPSDLNPDASILGSSKLNFAIHDLKQPRSKNENESGQDRLLEILAQPEALETMSSQFIDFFNSSISKLIQDHFTGERGIELALLFNPRLLPPELSPQTFNGEPIPIQVNLWPLNVAPDIMNLAVSLNRSPGSKSTKGDGSTPREIGPCPFTCAPYDVAVAVNQELLQDFFDQAFRMKLLENIKSPHGLISIQEPPQIEFVSSSANRRATDTLKLKIHVNPKRINLVPVVLQSKSFSVKVEVTLRLIPGLSGQSVKVELVDVNPYQLVFDESAASKGLGRLARFVPDKIKTLVQEAAFDFMRQFLMTSSAAGQIQVAPPEALLELLGPVKLSSLGFDANQALHLFLKLEP